MGDGGICRASVTGFQQKSKHSLAEIRCSELLVDIWYCDKGRIVSGGTKLTDIRTHNCISTSLIREALNYATKEDIVGDGLECQVPVPGYLTRQKEPV